MERASSTAISALTWFLENASSNLGANDKASLTRFVKGQHNDLPVAIREIAALQRAAAVAAADLRSSAGTAAKRARGGVRPSTPTPDDDGVCANLACRVGAHTPKCESHRCIMCCRCDSCVMLLCAISCHGDSLAASRDVPINVLADSFFQKLREGTGGAGRRAEGGQESELGSEPAQEQDILSEMGRRLGIRRDSIVLHSAQLVTLRRRICFRRGLR
jgi:hypothetical protein